VGAEQHVIVIRIYLLFTKTAADMVATRSSCSKSLGNRVDDCAVVCRSAEEIADTSRVVVGRVDKNENCKDEEV